MFWASVPTSKKPSRTLLPHWSSASAPPLRTPEQCAHPSWAAPSYTVISCLPQRLIQRGAGHREAAQETSKEGQARSGLQFWAGACSCPMSLPPWLWDSAFLPHPNPTNTTACAMLSRPGCPKPHVPATSLSRYRFPRKMSKSMARFYGRRHEEAFEHGSVQIGDAIASLGFLLLLPPPGPRLLPAAGQRQLAKGWTSSFGAKRATGLERKWEAVGNVERLTSHTASATFLLQTPKSKLGRTPPSNLYLWPAQPGV